MARVPNPNIPLSVKNFSIADSIQQGKRDSIENKLGEFAVADAPRAADARDLGLAINQQRADTQQRKVSLEESLAGREEELSIAAQMSLQIQPLLEQGDTEGAFQIASQGQDANSQKLAQMIRANPQQALAATTGAISVAERMGIIKPENGGVPAGQQEFESLIAGMSPADQAKARRIKAGLDPRAGSSSTERIALNQQLTDLVAASQGNIAGAKTAAQQEASRKADIIDQGVEVADGAAVIKRGLQLLKLVGTGGRAEQVKLRAKQEFGIESADEGELSALLGKAVLAQLRETFGAQFTEREGARLEQIEAGFGKSNATNERLLSQALKIIESKANRAIRLARADGDEATAQIIEEALSLDLAPVDEPVKVGRFTVEAE